MGNFCEAESIHEAYSAKSNMNIHYTDQTVSTLEAKLDSDSLLSVKQLFHSCLTGNGRTIGKNNRKDKTGSEYKLPSSTGFNKRRLRS